jgi:hypothetical protein
MVSLFEAVRATLIESERRNDIENYRLSAWRVPPMS